MSELQDLENKSVYIIKRGLRQVQEAGSFMEHGQGQHCRALALPEGFIGQDSLSCDSYRHEIQV